MADRHQDAGIATRYATAIFELAQEEKSVERLEADFATLKALMAENPDLARLVGTPIFSREDQANAMKAVLERMEASPLTTRFVAILASKRRLFALASIIRAFEDMLAKQRGEIQAHVTSARTLSDGQLSELKAMLKSRLGRDPRIDARVDPSLLGGLVVQVGSRMIDSSLRTKLNGIRLAMRGS